MIGALKAVIKRRWPALRLRTILFGTLLFTAALPGVGALFLRVYENTLVRQTEAELVAQGAALVATAQVLWPGAEPSEGAQAYRPEASAIDLRSTPVLGERPTARPRRQPPDPRALEAARKLAPIARTTRRTTLASIHMIDRGGVIVLGSDAGGSYAQVEEVSQALQGRVRTVLRTNGAYNQVYAFEWLSRASSLRIHHVRPIVVNGEVVGALLLSRSPRALFRGLYEDRGKIILGVVLIFAILIVLAGLVSRGIARPIEALGAATRGVAAGTGTVPDAPRTAAIEIRELFDNFQAMAGAIDRRSRYLRDFAASVSHEFKTPLAGIAGAIELIEDHGATMTQSEREHFLANIKADAARLAQLVARLMDLARADMAQPEPNAVTDVLAVAREVADAFAAPGLAVIVEATTPLPPAAAPRSTVEAVLRTLIENARQAGARQVRVTIEARTDALSLLVSDDGGGIAPADIERVFEPFFTTRRAHGGTGLGLAISVSLLRASGGTLSLVEGREAGTCFAMSLPTVDADRRLTPRKL